VQIYATTLGHAADKVCEKLNDIYNVERIRPPNASFKVISQKD